MWVACGISTLKGKKQKRSEIFILKNLGFESLKCIESQVAIELTLSSMYSSMDLYFFIRAGFAFSSSFVIVRRALLNKSLDSSGAIAAFVVGFVLTITNLSFFASLIVFFLSSSKLTKFRADFKREVEDDFKEGVYVIFIIANTRV